MPPVEFDTIPRFVSSSTSDAKHSVEVSNVLELGSLVPILTRSKGSAPELSEVIKDVEVPEVDSDDETTMDKIMKDYSDEESADDSDYVPSEDSENEDEATTNDFVITRSKGITPDESGIVNDVEIPEVDSEDETTIDKIMKDYSDQEELSGDDSDYVPSEDSEDELEYDSDASISDDEDCLEAIEDVVIPKSSFTRSNRTTIEDVKIPEVSNTIVKDIPMGHSELSSFPNEIVEHLAGFTIVQTGITVVDVGLNICEEILSAPYKKHVQGVRRHLRAIRRSGKGSASAGIFSFFIELFMVNWFLSFIGLTLNVEAGSNRENVGLRNSSNDDEFCDDEESTVYKLMKEYDSQDDEDYVPGDCTEDSMEFESDCSDDETIIEKVMKEYNEAEEDSDFVPNEEESDDEEGIEYDSDAEVSEDSDYDSSDVEDCSEDETTIEKIMKHYSDEESDFDADYVPGEEEVEDDIEFDSDASITDVDNDESESDICSEVESDDEDVEVSQAEEDESQVEEDEDESQVEEDESQVEEDESQVEEVDEDESQAEEDESQVDDEE